MIYSITCYFFFRLLFSWEPYTPSTLYPLLVDNKVEGTGKYLWALTKKSISAQTDAYQSISQNITKCVKQDNKSQKPLPTFNEGDKCYIY